jgi:hypothetical protein
MKLGSSFLAMWIIVGIPQTIMKSSTLSAFCLCLFASLLLGCSVDGSQNYRVVTLSSGKQVKVLSVGKISFSQGDPALMLKYQTDLSVDNRVVLQQEVAEIWESFRGDVEKAQLNSAVISANDVPKGIVIKTGKSYNFVYQKTKDGNWQISNS